MERKLAAIFSADVKGYSRLMGEAAGIAPSIFAPSEGEVCRADRPVV
jgi:hypothetical protein